MCVLTSVCVCVRDMCGHVHCVFQAFSVCLTFQLYKKARNLGFGDGDVSAVFKATSS